MNKVFLSGIVADRPVSVRPENGSTHLVFLLNVRHRTSKGMVKQELYTVNAWNGPAQWGGENLRQGQLVTVQGYLTQHIRENGILSVEVTAEEFLPGVKPGEPARAAAGGQTEGVAGRLATEKDSEAVAAGETASQTSADKRERGRCR